MSKKSKITTDEFIKKAKEIHGENYDYSKVDYTNTKIDVVCVNHSGFWQSLKTFFGFGKKQNWVSWEDFLSASR